MEASLVQSSVSHDPSEIILNCLFAAQETLLLKTVVLIHVCENCDTFFSQKSLMTGKL